MTHTAPGWFSLIVVLAAPCAGFFGWHAVRNCDLPQWLLALFVAGFMFGAVLDAADMMEKIFWLADASALVGERVRP